MCRSGSQRQLCAVLVGMVSWLLCAVVLAGGAQGANEAQDGPGRGIAPDHMAAAPALDQADKPGKPKVRQPSDLKKQAGKPQKMARQSDTVKFGGGKRFTFAIPVKGSGDVELNASWTPEAAGTVTVSAPGERRPIAEKKGRGAVSLSIPVAPRNVGEEWRVDVYVPQRGRGVTGELTVFWPGEDDGRLAWTNSCLAGKKERNYLKSKAESIRHVLAGNEPRTAEEEWLADRLEQNPGLGEALQEFATACDARLEAREFVPASRLRKTDARPMTPVIQQASEAQPGQPITTLDTAIEGTRFDTYFMALECDGDYKVIRRPFVIAGFVRQDGSFRHGGFTPVMADLKPGERRPLAWANDRLFTAETGDRSYLVFAVIIKAADVDRDTILDEFLLLMDDPTGSIYDFLGARVLGTSETLTLVPDGIYTEQDELVPWNTEGEHGEGYMYSIRFETVGEHYKGFLRPLSWDADFTVYVRIAPD